MKLSTSLVGGLVGPLPESEVKEREWRKCLKHDRSALRANHSWTAGCCLWWGTECILRTGNNRKSGRDFHGTRSGISTAYIQLGRIIYLPDDVFTESIQGSTLTLASGSARFWCRSFMFTRTPGTVRSVGSSVKCWMALGVPIDKQWMGPRGYSGKSECRYDISRRRAPAYV